MHFRVHLLMGLVLILFALLHNNNRSIGSMLTLNICHLPAFTCSCILIFTTRLLTGYLLPGQSIMGLVFSFFILFMPRKIMITITNGCDDKDKIQTMITIMTWSKLYSKLRRVVCAESVLTALYLPTTDPKRLPRNANN